MVDEIQNYANLQEFDTYTRKFQLVGVGAENVKVAKRSRPNGECDFVVLMVLPNERLQNIGSTQSFDARWDIAKVKVTLAQGILTIAVPKVAAAASFEVPITAEA